SKGPFRCFEWSWGQDLLGGAFFRLAGGSGGAGSLDVGDHQVVAVGQGQQLNTLRQGQLGQVDVLTDFQVGHVHVDEVRQVLRQAGNFQLRSDAVQLAASLDADAGFFVQVADRHVGGQLLAGNHALEVGVHDEALGRVALQGLQDHVFGLVTEVQGDHAAEGDFVFQGRGQFVGGQADGLGFLVATVDNGGNQVGVTTQAAARTFPQVG